MNENFSRKDRFAIGIISIIVIFILGWSASSYFGNGRDYTNNLRNKELSISGTSTIDFEPFWQTWNTLNEKYVATKKARPDDQTLVWGAIQGMVNAVGDPYTVFMPPEEHKMFSADISGNFVGIGAEVASKNGVVVIIAPLKSSPAEKAGLRAGDYILTINGTSTVDMPIERAVSLIRGEKGTKVDFKVFREGEKDDLAISVTREVINIPTIDTEIKNDVFIIHLYDFYEPSPNEFRGALRKFIDVNTDKLIIDLRGNPGGYLDAAVDIASWFLPLGKVVVSESYGNDKAPDYYRSKGYNIFNDNLKLAILIDSGSASASEILAGALHDYNKAILVGTKSYGKGSVQELIPITSETALKVTIARWLTPKGVSISEGGLTPDFEVKITGEDLAKKRDPQLDKAISILTKIN
ncbi:MAG: S41 family peptidase [Candidatus Paceibacterota bacterium]